MLKPSDILRQGLEKLRDGAGWTQGVFARNAKGDSCEHGSVLAVCFCGVGAIRAVTNDVQDANYWVARTSLSNSLYEYDLAWTTWQDAPERTFPEVKARFLQAIALAEAKESSCEQVAA